MRVNKYFSSVALNAEVSSMVVFVYESKREITRFWSLAHANFAEIILVSGVSFEQLAKGDVQFSKKYTIKELHDRWHAILYDPVVSAEVSARMLEFEHSDAPPYIKSNVIGNIEDHILAPGKRKGESIRKRFYAMRKKMRDQPLNPLDTSVIAQLKNNEADQPLNSPDTSVPNASENNNGFVTEEAAGSLTCDSIMMWRADINIELGLENVAYNEEDDF
ncbi:putative forkhead-associated domain-containing protein [Tanacetum coccineum]